MPYHHRAPSPPRSIDQLPTSFHHAATSPPTRTVELAGGSAAGSALPASSSSSASMIVVDDIKGKRPALPVMTVLPGAPHQLSHEDTPVQDRVNELRGDHFRLMDGQPPASSQDAEMAEQLSSIVPNVPYRPHHPQNDQGPYGVPGGSSGITYGNGSGSINNNIATFSKGHATSTDTATPSTTASYQPAGFGVKGPPGGDCKRVCLRHQRMVDGGARVELQKRLEKLPEAEQQMANTIWSLFSSSSATARILTLQGMLAICCPSQLSFLTEQLKAECRLDPFAVLPRELSLKCMGFLDAISLGRAAQVSKSWKALADDDLLWRTMCEQHIERKCEKCGWGLPLLERKRKQQRSSSPGSRSSSRSAAAAVAQAQLKFETSEHNHTPLPKSLEEALAQSYTKPAKRPRLDPSSSSTNIPLDHLTIASSSSSPAATMAATGVAVPSGQIQLTRPWKSVYCERLAIARNWARGNCKFRSLSGHTDAITCLQIDETLSNPSYPVLMTGSWDRTVRIWNAETGQCVNVLKGHTRGVRCIQFDSVKLITGSMDCTLKIWSWRTGQCIRTLEGHRDAVISLCFDKHVLASGSADSTIKVWDFNTAECFTLRGHREWVNQVKIWSPEATDCTPTPTASETVDTVSGTGSGASQAGLSSGGFAPPPAIKLLFSASDDGTVKVWDLLTRQCVRTLEGHVAQVQCLKVLSVADSSASSYPPNSASNDQPNSYINAAENAAAANNNGRNRFQAIDDGDQSNSLMSDSHASDNVEEGNANVGGQPWRPSAAPTKSELLGLPYVDFGDGRAPLIISGSLDNTIKMWNVEEGTCVRTLFGHIEGVWAVDMDKLRIVSASHDRTIKIWDRVSGKCLHTLVGHRGAVTSVALGDDKIISGSDDSTVRIWSFAQ